MKHIVSASKIERRTVLSALPALSILTSTFVSASAAAQTTSSILPSWNDGPAKQAIFDFVKATIDSASPNFVQPDERIATFDQDGTMWVEHPLYTQAFFALDRVHELAQHHPEWTSHEPFKAVLANDSAALAYFSERDWAELIFATHAGMTQTAFMEIATAWIATAKHPTFKRPVNELVYQPMIELLAYLRANAFSTYIVTGGGQDFVRAYSQRVYGIPTQNVIGSSLVAKYELQNGVPELVRLPKLFFDNNFGGKAVGIDTFIGKRPLAAFGNSTGDQQMLEYAKGGPGARLSMLVLHDDDKREFAYGPAKGLPSTKVGTFTQLLYDEATKSSWPIISMKNDWRHVFGFEL